MQKGLFVIDLKKLVLAGLLGLVGICGIDGMGGAHAQTPDPSQQDPTLWPEAQRAFYQDGPALLLPRDQRDSLLSLDEAGRDRFIRQLLDRDPIPDTPVNELRVGIEKRQRLATADILSPRDVRAQLLFLNGAPDERKTIDCGQVFVPMEIWSYRSGTTPEGKPAYRQLLVYARPGEPWKLWLPADSKRPLYIPQMEYWMEQWEELRGQIQAVRFDLQICREAVELVDKVTGVPGMTGARSGGKERVHPKDASSFLAPPAEIADWARAAAATPVPDAPPALNLASFALRFPDKDNQRMVSRARVSIAPGSLKAVKPANDRPPIAKVTVDGLVESAGTPFDQFRMRFELPQADPSQPVPLAIDRLLRPGGTFLLRLRIQDETGHGEARISRAFVVPEQPTGDDQPPGAAAAGALVPQQTASGRDSLLLLPPAQDVVLGLWRAETLVTGDRIKKVVFLVDGQAQLTRATPPFSAEVRLNKFPTLQVVRAEGYDEDDKLVAADEVVLNQPRGALAVYILEPKKGEKVSGRTTVKTDITVPDGRRMESLELKVNDVPVAKLTKPPWEASIAVPNDDVVYLAVAATLDDGTRAEAVRFLRSPQYLEEVDVNLVEMYVAVTDRSGQLVEGLTQNDFEVYENGKSQEISKFELVQNLPLTVGVLIDTSGSMANSLAQAEQAAAGFLDSAITPRDKCFAVSFAARPRLEMPPTDDKKAVETAISGLQAVGDTALHDALVHSLYYFRGMQGQRALILLSDGDDNASYIQYKDALEYARRSGVAIYAIGLNLPAFATGLRSKLSEMSEVTGGKAFFTGDPTELAKIYKQIERELRSRYLVAYNSNQPGKAGQFQEVEVKVKRGLKARTSRGYYR
jgi:Ca-activated chloride channel family protein